ncbi:putative aldouronate transport system permease protein [Streptacidiphilus jiangxiensis]|uniref:Putative aldouronate transport system permease protein n=2 Tax=Streptacidiphilus jiangxiensis TaxID=235985 RepID=A0A1H7Z170_STRJI|nr:ABC transporter permease subunit [Streptacidiphilus jiangxiensis]SEM52066.1 putative aldouronate transport system permease protein [Streptacidiphilus jiangxiensis]
MSTARAERARRPPRLNWRIRLRRDKSLILMTVPAVVLLLAFNYLPLFGLATAFQDYDPLVGVWHSDWVGFDQFRQLFSDPLFWESMKNTLYLSFVQLILFFPVPVALALLLNSVLSERLRNFIQSVAYLPHFFSWVLTITVFQQMLGGAGALNQFLRQHNMGTWDIMTNPHTFALLVTSQAVWKEAGWGIIVFLAALAGINQELYEAAAVDGAGRFRRMWHITLPGMRGVVVLMLVLRLGNALSVGFEQFLIQRDAVGHDAADVLDTFSFYYGIATGNYSYGAAAGLFKSVISLLLIWGANRLAHAFGEDGLYRG